MGTTGSVSPTEEKWYTKNNKNTVYVCINYSIGYNNIYITLFRSLWSLLQARKI